MSVDPMRSPELVLNTCLDQPNMQQDQSAKTLYVHVKPQNHDDCAATLTKFAKRV